jgi:hypothetical protein
VSTDGEALNNLTRGVPYLRRAGAEHYVFNANDFEFAFIEIEQPPAPPAASVSGILKARRDRPQPGR